MALITFGEELPVIPEPPEPDVEKTVNPESVLATVKAGSIPDSLTAFDQELIYQIESALRTIKDVGAPITSYRLDGYNTLWSWVCSSEDVIPLLKEYVTLRVKLIFDTPSTSYIINLYESRIKELEWRIRRISEDYKEGGEEDSE